MLFRSRRAPEHRSAPDPARGRRRQAPAQVAEFTNSNDISNFYSLSRTISYLLNSGLNGNPRQFKRFLNEFEMRKKVAKLKKIEIDEKVLVKMMMLQYVKPNIFADFIELYGKGNLNMCLSRSEEHTSELQSPSNLVCRLLLEKKN